MWNKQLFEEIRGLLNFCCFFIGRFVLFLAACSLIDPLKREWIKGSFYIVSLQLCYFKQYAQIFLKTNGYIMTKCVEMVLSMQGLTFLCNAWWLITFNNLIVQKPCHGACGRGSLFLLTVQLLNRFRIGF